MARLTIESAGPGATIQDGGRFGFQRFGVTPAGPMDWTAFETANAALGNPRQAAAIEIASGGLALSSDGPACLAFAGGGFAWTRDDRALPAAARVILRPGEVLRARPGASGAFAYCAVPGGVEVPEIMHSRSTHVRSRLGGCDGRMLRGGDQLATAGDDCHADDVEIRAPWLVPSHAPIRIVLGPQDDHFTDDALAILQSADFELTGSADRMAYKFEGPNLTHAKDFNIVSDGISLGAIQVAGDGQPIVLMADRQPTGGYTKIAHVCRADIGRLAQLRPGETCRFRAIDTAAARRALVAAEDQIENLSEMLQPLRATPTTTALLETSLVGGVVSAR